MSRKIFFGHNKGIVDNSVPTPIDPAVDHPGNPAIFLVDLTAFRYTVDGDGKVSWVENGIADATCGDFSSPVGKRPQLVMRNGFPALRFDQFSGMRSMGDTDIFVTDSTPITLFIVCRPYGTNYTWGSSIVSLNDYTYGFEGWAKQYKSWISGNTTYNNVFYEGLPWADDTEFISWGNSSQHPYTFRQDIDSFQIANQGINTVGNNYGENTVNLGTYRNYENGLDVEILYAYAVKGFLPEATYNAIREKIRSKFGLHFPFLNHQSLFNGPVGTPLSSYVPDKGNPLVLDSGTAPVLNGNGCLTSSGDTNIKVTTPNKINEYEQYAHMTYNNIQHTNIAIWLWLRNGDLWVFTVGQDSNNHYCTADEHIRQADGTYVYSPHGTQAVFDNNPWITFSLRIWPTSHNNRIWNIKTVINGRETGPIPYYIYSKPNGDFHFTFTANRQIEDIQIRSQYDPVFTNRCLRLTTGNFNYIEALSYSHPAGLTGITVEFWQKVNPATELGGNTFLIYTSSTERIYVQTYSGQLYVECGSYDNGGNQNNRVLANYSNQYNKWAHVALVANSNGRRACYINGELAAENLNGDHHIPAGTKLVIGQGVGGQFIGDVDEFRVWTTERTQAQLKANMHTKIQAPQAGLQAYYQFDALTEMDANGRSFHLDKSGNNFSADANNTQLVDYHNPNFNY